MKKFNWKKFLKDTGIIISGPIWFPIVFFVLAIGMICVHVLEVIESYYEDAK